MFISNIYLKSVQTGLGALINLYMCDFMYINLHFTL